MTNFWFWKVVIYFFQSQDAFWTQYFHPPIFFSKKHKSFLIYLNQLCGTFLDTSRHSTKNNLLFFLCFVTWVRLKSHFLFTLTLKNSFLRPKKNTCTFLTFAIKFNGVSHRLSQDRREFKSAETTVAFYFTK